MLQLCSWKSAAWLSIVLAVNLWFCQTPPTTIANDEATAGPPNLVVVWIQEQAVGDGQAEASPLVRLRREGVSLGGISLGTRQEFFAATDELGKTFVSQHYAVKRLAASDAAEFVRQNRHKPLMITVDVETKEASRALEKVLDEVQDCYLSAQTLIVCAIGDASGNAAKGCVLRYSGKLPAGKRLDEKFAAEHLLVLIRQMTGLPIADEEGSPHLKLSAAIGRLAN